jgi:hypothetical protein
VYSKWSLQKSRPPTFTEPIRDRSVRIRIPEHIHRKRHNRQRHITRPQHSLTGRGRIQDSRLDIRMLSLIKSRGVPEENGDRLVSIQNSKLQIRLRTLIEVPVLLGNLEPLTQNQRMGKTERNGTPERTGRTAHSHHAVVNCPPLYEAIQLAGQRM